MLCFHSNCKLLRNKTIATTLVYTTVRFTYPMVYRALTAKVLYERITEALNKGTPYKSTLISQASCLCSKSRVSHPCIHFVSSTYLHAQPIAENFQKRWCTALLSVEISGRRLAPFRNDCLVTAFAFYPFVLFALKDEYTLINKEHVVISNYTDLCNWLSSKNYSHCIWMCHPRLLQQQNSYTEVSF